MNRTPYGSLGWVHLLVNCFALLFFMLPAFHCFLTVDKTDNYKVFVGYWGAESIDIAQTAGKGNDNNYCIPWDKQAKDDIFDGVWRFGRTLGIIGSLVSIPFSIMAFYIIVYRVESRIFTVAAGTYICMSIISLLLLVGLGSEVCSVHNCKLGPGGYFAILDFFLWIGAAVVASRLRTLNIDDREEDLPVSSSTTKPFPALPPSTTGQENLSQKV
jgi:hypothetical protein